MDKKFISRILVIGAVLAAAVLWLLTVIPPTAGYFSWFSLAWAGVIVSGALALKYIFGGIFSHANVVVRKFSIIFGALFLIVTLFCVVWAISMPHDWIAPLIAIIVTGALFAAVLFTGGRKWDAGDNQKVGYKNYYQRKAEEEKNAKKDK